MNITKMKDRIKNMILKNKRPWSILLLGPPGIGKSEIAREALEEIAEKMHTEVVEANESSGKDLVVYHRIEVPFVTLNDLKGVPQVKGDHYVYLPPKWVKSLREAKYGLLVLDDITETTDPYLTFVAADIAFTGYVGDMKFNKPVVATGNPKDFSILAESTPFNANIRAGRMGTVIVAPAPVSEWHKYMIKKSNKDGFNYDGLEAKFLLMTSYFGVKSMYDILKILLLCDDFYIAVPEIIAALKSLLPSKSSPNNLQTPRSWTTAVATSEYSFFLPSYISSVYENFRKNLKEDISEKDLETFDLLAASEHDTRSICRRLHQQLELEGYDEESDIHEAIFEMITQRPFESDVLNRIMEGREKSLDELARLTGSLLATLLNVASAERLDPEISKKIPKLQEDAENAIRQLKKELKTLEEMGRTIGNRGQE